MRRFPQLAAYVATFGSMTAAAIVAIALIILNAGSEEGPQGDGGPVARAVVAEQNIAAGTEISEDMVKVIEVPEDLLVSGAFSDTPPVIGQVTTMAIASGEQITPSRIGSGGAAFTVTVNEPLYSGDASPLEGCQVPSDRSSGGFMINPIERTLAYIRASNTCNQPDLSTAQATRSTWDTAHAIVQARGASITKTCEPTCSPDDHTKVWIVEVHGTFVPPESVYGGAMVPDSTQADETPPNTPVAGTWFSIIPVLNY